MEIQYNMFDTQETKRFCEVSDSHIAPLCQNMESAPVPGVCNKTNLGILGLQQFDSNFETNSIENPSVFILN